MHAWPVHNHHQCPALVVACCEWGAHSASHKLCTMQALVLWPAQSPAGLPRCSQCQQLSRPLHVQGAQQQQSRRVHAGAQPQQTPPNQRQGFPPNSQQQQQQPYGQQQPYYPPPPQQQPPGGSEEKKLGSYANALIAAAFIAGLGIGVYFDSEVTLSPNNVSSTEIIDRTTPNADVCMANGYSASVFDMKLYVTFNPFNVYTTQPVIKSGCVLRRANVGVLERESLVTQHEVDLCKSRMNTFAYMGDLKNSPEVACVYHSEEAENQYLDTMRKRGMGGGIPMPDVLNAAPAAKQ